MTKFKCNLLLKPGLPPTPEGHLCMLPLHQHRRRPWPVAHQRAHRGGYRQMGWTGQTFSGHQLHTFKSFQQLMHILFWLTGLLFTRQFDPRRDLQICNRSCAAFYYWWDREPVSHAYSGSFWAESLLLSKCIMQIHVLYFCRCVSRWVPVLLSMNKQCIISYVYWLTDDRTQTLLTFICQSSYSFLH